MKVVHVAVRVDYCLEGSVMEITGGLGNSHLGKKSTKNKILVCNKYIELKLL
jgi:hypothetical protein